MVFGHFIQIYPSRLQRSESESEGVGSRCYTFSLITEIHVALVEEVRGVPKGLGFVLDKFFAFCYHQIQW